MLNLDDLDAVALQILGELDTADVMGEKNLKTVVTILEDVVDKAKDEERKEVLGE